MVSIVQFMIEGVKILTLQHLKDLGVTTKNKAVACLCADLLGVPVGTIAENKAQAAPRGGWQARHVFCVREREKTPGYKHSRAFGLIKDEEAKKAEHDKMASFVYERTAADFFDAKPPPAARSAVGPAAAAARAATSAATAAAMPTATTLAEAASSPLQPHHTALAVPASAESAAMDVDGMVTRHAARPVTDPERAELKRTLADSQRAARLATKAIVSARITEQTRSRELVRSRAATQAQKGKVEEQTDKPKATRKKLTETKAALRNETNAVSKLTKKRDALIEGCDEQESYITVQDEEKRDLNATIDKLKGELKSAQRAEGVAAESGERERKCEMWPTFHITRDIGDRSPERL